MNVIVTIIIFIILYSKISTPKFGLLPEKTVLCALCAPTSSSKLFSLRISVSYEKSVTFRISNVVPLYRISVKAFQTVIRLSLECSKLARRTLPQLTHKKAETHPKLISNL